MAGRGRSAARRAASGHRAAPATAAGWCGSRAPSRPSARPGSRPARRGWRPRCCWTGSRPPATRAGPGRPGPASFDLAVGVGQHHLAQGPVQRPPPAVGSASGSGSLTQPVSAARQTRSRPSPPRVVVLLDEAVPGQQPQVVAAGAGGQAGHLGALGRRRRAVQLEPFQDRVPAGVRQRAQRAGVGDPPAVRRRGRCVRLVVMSPRISERTPSQQRCEALPSHLWTPRRRPPAPRSAAEPAPGRRCPAGRRPAAATSARRCGPATPGWSSPPTRSPRSAARSPCSRSRWRRRSCWAPARCRWACSTAAGTAPYVGFALVVGAWVDRLRRRRPLMIAADLVAAAALLTVPLGLGPRRCSRCTQLIAVELVVGVARVTFRPTFSTHLPDVVPAERPPTASVSAARRRRPSRCSPARPSAARWCSSSPRRSPCWWTRCRSCSRHCWSAGSARPSGSATSPPPRRRLAQEIGEGMSYLWSATAGCAPSPGAAANVNFFGLMVFALLVVYLTRDHDFTPLMIAAVTVAGGLGSLAGALVAPRVAAADRPRPHHHRWARRSSRSA